MLVMLPYKTIFETENIFSFKRLVDKNKASLVLKNYLGKTFKGHINQR
jgi:hypothetical protein